MVLKKKYGVTGGTNFATTNACLGFCENLLTDSVTDLSHVRELIDCLMILLDEVIKFNIFWILLAIAYNLEQALGQP